MYTIDDQREDLYEDDDYKISRWDNNKGLIFKIIIIILCIIVLIWLIKALNSNRNLTDNSSVHNANVEKLRLAAEDYFFIQNNKEKTNYVSLAALKDAGLISNIVDANNKTCNEHSTKVNIDKEIDAYKMTVQLSCSTKDNDEIFYYHRNTLACLNCGNNTKMLGKEIVIAKADEKEIKEENGGQENVNNNIQYDYDEYSKYSCINWTDWSKDRIYDSDLTERTKTLVQGVKYGSKTVYSEWSDYTTTPIVGNDTIEVETQVITEEVWSGNKTGTNIDENNKNIKIISSELVNETNNSCASGYVQDGKCFSYDTKKGNLTFTEYFSGNYNVKEQFCKGTKTLQDKEGKYVLTYVDCEYDELIGKANVSNNSYRVYTYQELTTKNVTYYRYRTISTVSEPDSYTETKYEEEYLPEGYVKVPGSEETYYSYKLTECIK